ncbi:MAG: hypothetical protein GXO95_07670, partial [Nitrospirae bacterium]|nr:hypothetical protein [Nitrospirota bacterium]
MKFRIGLIVFLLVVVSIIVTLNLFFQRNYQAEMAAQFNQQQLIIAKTIASSIQTTLKHLEDETRVLSQLLAYRGLQEDGMAGFIANAFPEPGADIGIDMMVLDAGERPVFSTLQGVSLNEDDRRLYELTKGLSPGEVRFSDRITETGKIRLATPITKGGRFIGSILLGVNMDDVTRKYFYPVKSGERGYAWMMDSSGTLIYHPTEPAMIGRNIFRADKSCYGCHESFRTEIQILGAKEVGFSSYIAPQGEDKLVAFSKINIGHMNWIICVSIPYSEVTASIKNSLRLHSMLVLAIFLATVIGAFVVVMINRERVKAEEKALYMDKLKEYAQELEDIVQERTKELKSEKEKLDAIVSSLEAGICIFDEQERPVWMNRVMQEWLSEECMKNLALNKLQGDTGAANTVCSATVDNRLIQEVAYLDLGNKKGYFQVTSTPLKTPDGRCRILVLVQDVTEMKKAEEQLMQSEKLTALSRLSAGVAHEIGNPLTSISSYVQILRDMDFDDFTRDALNTIAKHINRIATIVRQMSSFAKTKAEDIKPFRVRDLISSTLELVKYDKRTKNIQIEL